MAPMKVARVALDVPLPTLFDYALPAQLEEPPAALVGRRVIVPFGRARQIGVIFESGVEAAVERARIRPLERLCPGPALPTDVMHLLRFASEYYHHPIGQAALGALPQRLRQTRVQDESGVECMELTAEGRLIDPAALPARAATRRRLFGLLRERGALPAAELRALAPGAGRVLLDMIRLGHAHRLRMPLPAPAPAVQDAPPTVALTPEQQHAVDALVSARGFAPFLLRGITGSGKTEVYLEMIAALRQRALQALVLVPEINLTPQLLARFRARFPGATLAVLHSNLAEGERMGAWSAAQRGNAAVVIGTRLAVFTPLPALGAIIVDEEHDASFKQQDGLRYSARDLALLRGKLRDVPVVLGSATPSLESYANALSGRYRLLELSSRPAAALPAIRCIDTRRAPLQHGLSPALVEALRARVARGEQSLVFLNRRGYAPALVCPACGWACPCTRCSARLVLHLKDQRLRCHYCGHEEPIARICPACGNQDLMPAGHGTQRLEQALASALPGARILRVDRDTTRARHAFAGMQARIREHQVDVLVGTQMLAKGHDFPRLTLVGVVNADGALYSTDFRASERLYAMLTQVAGRAGRAGLPGEVLIQTDFPLHPLYDAVCRQDYAAFARAALDERKAAVFPPYSHQALLRAEAARRDTVDAYLERAAQVARGLRFAVDVYDPVPPAIARVAGRERGHLLVQASARAELQRFLAAWHPHLGGTRAVRWSLDVDPLEV
jgi:primosomal protein N' (replication factor Y) (superfamily II helicase)